jgi:hypothetical protein
VSFLAASHTACLGCDTTFALWQCGLEGVKLVRERRQKSVISLVCLISDY